MKKLGILVISIILGISMIGCTSSKINKDENLATVNGTGITVGNYEKVLELNKSSIEMRYGEDAWDQEDEEGIKLKDKFKENILNQMIYIEVIYQAAKKETLLPTEKEINEGITRIKDEINKNEEAKKNFDKIGIDDNFLKYQTERELAMKKYKTNFDKNINLNDIEMEEYYNKNKESFYVDKVKASHILLKTTDDKNESLNNEKKAEVKKKAEEIISKIKNGEDFSTLAKEYSEDGSASDGGNLGFFEKGQMVKEFEDSAFSMNVGDVSDLVETKFGYHIIKVTDKKKIDEKTQLKDAKSEVNVVMINEKYNKQVEELKKAAKVEIKKDELSKVKL